MTVLMNLSLVYVLSQNIGGVIFAFDLIHSQHFILHCILNPKLTYFNMSDSSYAFSSNHTHGGTGVGIYMYIIFDVQILTDTL